MRRAKFTGACPDSRLPQAVEAARLEVLWQEGRALGLEAALRMGRAGGDRVVEASEKDTPRYPRQGYAACVAWTGSGRRYAALAASWIARQAAAASGAVTFWRGVRVSGSC